MYVCMLAIGIGCMKETNLTATIRYLKSHRFGFALRYARTKRPERLETLLVLTALTTLTLWLLGLAASDCQWSQHFQANTERRCTVLSTVFLCQQMWRNHRFKITLAELFNALKRLKLLIIHEAHFARILADLAGRSVKYEDVYLVATKPQPSFGQVWPDTSISTTPGAVTAHWTDAPRMRCTSTKLTAIWQPETRGRFHLPYCAILGIHFCIEMDAVM